MPSLTSALARYEIDLPAEQVELLDRYCAALWEWNEKLNLTRHTDYEKFVSRDVVDSLALAGLLGRKERVLDVGTGGGVPGVILAIVRPDLRVALCESVAKKAKAVEEIVRQVPLPLPVYHARAEEVLEAKRFDTLVVRAVAPLAKLLTWLKPHWGAFRRLLVVKGRNWVEERAEARQRGLLRALELRRVAEYQTPGGQALNVVLQLRMKEAREEE